jgi:hypothetical protein
MGCEIGVGGCRGSGGCGGGGGMVEGGLIEAMLLDDWMEWGWLK